MPGMYDLNWGDLQVLQDVVGNSSNTYPSIESYLENLNNPAYQGDSNVLQFPNGQVNKTVQFQPDLTGGTKSGSSVVNIQHDDVSGEIIESGLGVNAGLSPLVAVSGILGAAGVLWTSTEGQELAALEAVRYLYNDNSIQREDLDKYQIPVIAASGGIISGINANSILIGEGIAKKILTSLQSQGFFDKEEGFIMPGETGSTVPISSLYSIDSTITTAYQKAYGIYGAGSPSYSDSYQNLGSVAGNGGLNDLITTQIPMYISNASSANIIILNWMFQSGGEQRIVAILLKTNTEGPSSFIYVNEGGTIYSKIQFGNVTSVGSYVGYTTGRNNDTWHYVNAGDISTNGYVGYYDSGTGSVQTSNLNMSSQMSHIGVGAIAGATVPPSTGEIDIPTLYPDWANQGVTLGGLLKNGLLTNELVLPFPPGFLDNPMAQPLTQADAQEAKAPQTDPQKDALVRAIYKAAENTNPWADPEGAETDPLPQPTDPQPTPGDTITPAVIPTYSSGGKLFTVYKPSASDLNDIGASLWDSSIISQIRNLFQNPLDGIIELHQLYCTPSVGGSQTVYCGSVALNATAPVVTDQFVEIDCGSCNVPEYYGDATDYSPYTHVAIFLPFIGFKDLNGDDLIGGVCHVKYKVDVYTGACLATISVTKYGATQILYTFDGNCAVGIPITNQQSGTLVAGLRIAAAGLTGGAVGAGVSAIHQVANGTIGNKIGRNGSFTSNAGAMGIKKPYLVVNRKIPETASRYNHYYGFPSNKTVRLGSVSGYTRVKSVHVDIGGCTDREKQMIEERLKSGVYV